MYETGGQAASNRNAGERKLSEEQGRIGQTSAAKWLANVTPDVMGTEVGEEAENIYLPRQRWKTAAKAAKESDWVSDGWATAEEREPQSVPSYLKCGVCALEYPTLRARCGAGGYPGNSTQLQQRKHCQPWPGLEHAHPAVPAAGALPPVQGGLQRCPQR